jgi:alkanesulfonate monooxygenase SsuD/methylene tetrahydromethanopterin reductase-like flavin-dependent oxidoreductase (luciferase family)
VTRAAFRSAGLVAKLAAQLDDMSGGRMILGIGSGDEISEPEHAGFGLPHLDTAERRTHLVETVRAVRSLFRGEPWPGGPSMGPVAGPLLPPPGRLGGPPVWIGGASDSIVRLAAAEADAWNGWGLTLSAFERKAELLRRGASEGDRSVSATWAGIAVVGRDRADAERMMQARARRDLVDRDVWAGSAESLGRHLQGLAAAGADWAVLLPGGPGDRTELIAEEVLPRVGSAA